jgi:hypothetical protein
MYIESCTYILDTTCTDVVYFCVHNSYKQDTHTHTDTDVYRFMYRYTVLLYTQLQQMDYLPSLVLLYVYTVVQSLYNSNVKPKQDNLHEPRYEPSLLLVDTALLPFRTRWGKNLPFRILEFRAATRPLF